MTEEINKCFEFRSLRLDELEQVFDHCGECFAPRTERSYFVSHYTMDPTKDVKNILIAYDTAEKQIASCVKVFIRELHLQGKVMRCGGIGDVSTKEKYRRHGLASRLLKHAVQYMRELQLDMGILRAKPDLSPFYGKVGFVPVTMIGADLVVRENVLSSLPKLNAEILLINTADYQPLIPQLSAIFNHWSPQFNGTFVRSEEYWRTWTVPATAPDNRLFVALEHGKVVAYCFFQYRPQWESYEIRELLWVPQHEHPENLLPAFLVAILRVLQKTEMVCYVPNPVIRLVSFDPNSPLPVKELKEDCGNHYLMLKENNASLRAALTGAPPTSSHYTVNSKPLDWHVFFRVDAY